MRGEPYIPRSKGGLGIISTHSPRAGRTALLDGLGIDYIDFNSLAPCGANPMAAAMERLGMTISTHSPRAGRTPARNVKRPSCIGFQLTRPVRGEPKCMYHLLSRTRFQLTRPVRGEPSTPTLSSGWIAISTHSPRAGRTPVDTLPIIISSDFNSLAPCGANPGRVYGCDEQGDFNSLAPCGANPLKLAVLAKK